MVLPPVLWSSKPGSNVVVNDEVYEGGVCDTT